MFLVQYSMVSLASPTQEWELPKAGPSILSDLEAEGYAVRDGLVPAEVSRRCAVETSTLALGSLMRPGEILDADTQVRTKKKRGDMIHWLKVPSGDEVVSQSTGNLISVTKALTALAGELQQFFESSGLGRSDAISCMVASYPGDGTGYVKHRDSRADGVPGRKITAILRLLF